MVCEGIFKGFCDTRIYDPMNILEEFTNFASLGPLRIFGNIFAGEVLASLLVTLSHQAVYWYPFAFYWKHGVDSVFDFHFMYPSLCVYHMLSSIYIGKKINGEE